MLKYDEVRKLNLPCIIDGLGCRLERHSLRVDEFRRLRRFFRLDISSFLFFFFTVDFVRLVCCHCATTSDIGDAEYLICIVRYVEKKYKMSLIKWVLGGLRQNAQSGYIANNFIADKKL